MKITRHGNRKFYSPTTKGCVTYPFILQHIKAGGEIQVTCHKTHMDITDVVLRKCVEYNNNVSSTDLYAVLRK